MAAIVSDSARPFGYHIKIRSFENLHRRALLPAPKWQKPAAYNKYHATLHGLIASANNSEYIAAKHGLVILTKAAALESATVGVTFQAPCPESVLTPLLQKRIDGGVVEEIF